MTKKGLIKFVVVFGLLATVLIFLGVNYVPLTSASSSSDGSALNAVKYAGSDYVERHPSNYYSNSDWIERHPSSVADPAIYAGSDWIERHPSIVHGPEYYVGSDWIERHPTVVQGSEYYFGSDWIERHPGNGRP
jgi:hypothetical protein